MKKIILLLTVLTLGVIACDKNELGDMDSSSINTPIEMEDVKMDLDLDVLTSRLSRLSDQYANDNVKNSASTAKEAVAGSYITLISGVDNGKYFEFLFSDDIESCNVSNYSYLETIYLVLNSSNHTEIRVGDHSGTSSLLLGTIESNFSFLYTITFSEGLLVDLSSFTTSIVDGNSGTSFTF